MPSIFLKRAPTWGDALPVRSDRLRRRHVLPFPTWWRKSRPLALNGTLDLIKGRLEHSRGKLEEVVPVISAAENDVERERRQFVFLEHDEGELKSETWSN